MQFDDLLRDRETEAGAALLARAGAVDLLKLLEDALLVLGRNAGAGIGDGDVEGAVRGCRVHRDLAGLGELDGIADEIQQRLGDPPLVALPERQVLGDHGPEQQLLLGRQGFRGRHDRLDHFLDRVVGDGKGQLAGFDLGQIEDVVDQAEEVAPVALDALQDLPDLVGHLAVDVVLDQLRIAEDGVQGRSQLVTRVGEKLRLVPAGLLELVVEAPKLLAGPVDVGRQLRSVRRD